MALILLRQLFLFFIIYIIYYFDTCVFYIWVGRNVCLFYVTFVVLLTHSHALIRKIATLFFKVTKKMVKIPVLGTPTHMPK